MSKEGYWVTTFRGRSFSLSNPKVEDVDIYDIAHALSNVCRWTGHCCWFYSVAMHSIKVSEKVSDKYKLHALLHDAHEAYIGDISRPLKLLLGDKIREVQDSIDKVIFEALGVTSFSHEEVKEADNRMLVSEAYVLCSADTAGWSVKAERYRGEQFNCHTSRFAEEAFLTKFHKLKGEIP